MTDIIIYVAASGIDPSDRDSLGHTSSNLHAIDHNKNEPRLPHGFMGAAAAPAPMLTTAYGVDQEVE